MRQNFHAIVAAFSLVLLSACASGPQYRNVGKFNEGLAPVQQASSGKWGFINQRQQWVIQPRFEEAREFQDGRAAAKQRGKWGFINKQGKWQ